MKIKVYWMFVLVFVLSFALAACGGEAEDEPTAVPQATAVSVEESEPAVESEPTAEAAPTDTPQPEPTVTPEPAPTDTPEPEPTAEEVEEAAAPEIDFAALSEGLAQFDSYRLLILINFSGTDAQGSEVTQRMNMDISTQLNPPATNVTIEAEGITEFEEFGSLSMSQIDGISYMSFPGLGCITSAEDTGMLDSFGPDFLNTGQITDELENAVFVGEDEINEIEVLHYTIDSSMLDEDDEVDEIAGDIFIAKDGNYLVRMIVDGTGPVDFLSDGEDAYGILHMEYNLTQVNEDFDIILPEGCDAESGTGSAYAVMDDAYELSSFAGFTTYKTDSTFEDVVDFYEAAMLEDEWTKLDGESFVMEGTAILAYTKDNVIVRITIGEDDEDTQFVLITSE